MVSNMDQTPPTTEGGKGSRAGRWEVGRGRGGAGCSAAGFLHGCHTELIPQTIVSSGLRSTEKDLGTFWGWYGDKVTAGVHGTGLFHDSLLAYFLSGQNEE